MKKISRVILAALLILSLVMVGCSTAKPTETTTDENGNSEKVLRMAIQTEPPNLDPQVGTDTYSITINNALREGLVRFANNEIEPGMAESWEISPDQLTYTFHLRDAKWSDGTAVTAKDFEYSLLRLLNPETASQYAYIAYYIKNAQAFNEGTVTNPAEVGVKAVDDKTFEVTLERPTPYFIKKVGFKNLFPIRMDIVQAEGETFGTDFTKMVWNGPFKITEYIPNNKTVLEKNADYWDAENVKLAKITMQEITEV
jgi:oligopeptide transport system substrate-binding protein